MNNFSGFAAKEVQYYFGFILLCIFSFFPSQCQGVEVVASNVQSDQFDLNIKFEPLDPRIVYLLVENNDIVFFQGNPAKRIAEDSEKGIKLSHRPNKAETFTLNFRKPSKLSKNTFKLTYGKKKLSFPIVFHSTNTNSNTNTGTNTNTKTSTSVSHNIVDPEPIPDLPGTISTNNKASSSETVIPQGNSTIASPQNNSIAKTIPAATAPQEPRLPAVIATSPPPITDPVTVPNSVITSSIYYFRILCYTALVVFSLMFLFFFLKEKYRLYMANQKHRKCSPLRFKYDQKSKRFISNPSSDLLNSEPMATHRIYPKIDKSSENSPLLPHPELDLKPPVESNSIPSVESQQESFPRQTTSEAEQSNLQPKKAKNVANAQLTQLQQSFLYAKKAKDTANSQSIDSPQSSFPTKKAVDTNKTHAIKPKQTSLPIKEVIETATTKAAKPTQPSFPTKEEIDTSTTQATKPTQPSFPAKEEIETSTTQETNPTQPSFATKEEIGTPTTQETNPTQPSFATKEEIGTPTIQATQPVQPSLPGKEEIDTTDTQALKPTQPSFSAEETESAAVSQSMQTELTQNPAIPSQDLKPKPSFTPPKLTTSPEFFYQNAKLIKAPGIERLSFLNTHLNRQDSFSAENFSFRLTSDFHKLDKYLEISVSCTNSTKIDWQPEINPSQITKANDIISENYFCPSERSERHNDFIIHHDRSSMSASAYIQASEVSIVMPILSRPELDFSSSSLPKLDLGRSKLDKDPRANSGTNSQFLSSKKPRLLLEYNPGFLSSENSFSSQPELKNKLTSEMPSFDIKFQEKIFDRFGEEITEDTFKLDERVVAETNDDENAEEVKVNEVSGVNEVNEASKVSEVNEVEKVEEIRDENFVAKEAREDVEELEKNQEESKKSGESFSETDESSRENLFSSRKRMLPFKLTRYIQFALASGNGEIYEAMGSEISVGRSKFCELPLPGLNISKIHFVVKIVNDTLRITKISKSGETRLNKIVIHNEASIFKGDVIELGDIQFTVKQADIILVPEIQETPKIA
ncbi:MAG: FHA domain-containing protein [Candidatus Riflebacteria bacterium]|nr:FHA domain-containing protein [Candidatus Riflebacteria bacterium]